MKMKIKDICKISNRKVLDYFGFSSMLALIRIDAFNNPKTLEKHVDMLLKYLKYIRKDFDRAICRVDEVLINEDDLSYLTRFRYAKDQLEKIQKQLYKVRNGLITFKQKLDTTDMMELKQYLDDIEKLVNEFSKLENHIEW